MTERSSLASAVHAPEFPRAQWFNTDRPLSMAALRGKVVLLDFWTYGCINCMHIIPELKRLDKEFPDELVVVGVHSAKFKNEGDSLNLRQIVLRYELEHPVVNDRDFVIWRSYGVRAWPTVVLIDPAGYVVGQKAGEGAYDVVRPLVAALVEDFGSRGLLDRSPLQLKLEKQGLPQTELSFPGKVLADPGHGRLFVADSDHNRIVVAALDGNTVDSVIGGLEQGLVDGDYRLARFFRPQGLALSPDGSTLYVADTENHAIREVDLDAKTVTTIAGTGRQSEVYPGRGGPALEVELNSPWDVELMGDHLYVAMAGSHQIWRLDLKSRIIEPWAGSGAEGIDDGPIHQATLAQPSGLAARGGRLYFVDPESSSVRLIELPEPGTGRVASRVTTLVGTGLFDFGDEDGVGKEALLQHCLDLAVSDDGVLYVADTYNNKIKTVNPVSGKVGTFAGGTRGWRDGGQPLFYEPGGLDVAGDRLFVADTNNHAIRVVDLEDGSAETVYFRDPRGLLMAARTPASSETVEVPAVRLCAGSGTLDLDLKLGEGWTLDSGLPLSLEWLEGPVRFSGGLARRRVDAPALPLHLPIGIAPVPGRAVLHIDVALRDGSGLSRPFPLRVAVRIEPGAGADTSLNLQLTFP